MIRFTNIRNLRKDEPEQWLIMRSVKNKSDWLIHVPALSPSKELFFKYLNLKKKGQWNEDTFQKIYVPEFLYGIKANMDGSRDLLNRVYKMDKNGESVAMGCVCTIEEMCHRSIVAGLLQGAGCNVVTDTGKDYTKYWQQYQQM